MTSIDWRSPERYEHLRSLDGPGFAWEYLSRNPDFARDRAKLERAARRGPLSAAALEGFSKRWGVRFRKRQGYPKLQRRHLDCSRASERDDIHGMPSGFRRS
jgi:hypothetical protein